MSGSLQFKVDLLFGDQNVEYQATYVGTACHSTVYTLDGLLTPWSDENLPELLEAEKLSRIPEVSDESDLYNVTYSCGQSKGARFCLSLCLILIHVSFSQGNKKMVFQQDFSVFMIDFMFDLFDADGYCLLFG